jgi:hypothetical protein
MSINKIVLKASYNLQSEAEAVASAVRKVARDVRNGAALQTVKIPRFIQCGFDFQKFNFPICGNVSPVNLLTISAARSGLDTYIVGNEDTRRSTAVVTETLGLRNVHFIPELDISVESDPAQAKKILSFTHTQARAFEYMPVSDDELVLEVAADQPMKFNFYRMARDLDVAEVDFAINLNAVNLMQMQVPSFKRNCYFGCYNSQGQRVELKENNNFAQNNISRKANRSLFHFLYNNRNSGKFITNFAAMLAQRAVRLALRPDELFLRAPVLPYYGALGRRLSHAPAYETLQGVFNIFASPGFLSDRAHVDGTNDDVFACWDMDGLNNDFVGYHEFFARNKGDLGKVFPFADDVYRVSESIQKRGGIITEQAFREKYNSFLRVIEEKLHNPAYLRSLNVGDETIDKLAAINVDTEIGMDLRIKNGVDHSHLADLENYVRDIYMPRFERDRELYLGDK